MIIKVYVQLIESIHFKNLLLCFIREFLYGPKTNL
jgi:hypothetical protein